MSTDLQMGLVSGALVVVGGIAALCAAGQKTRNYNHDSGVKRSNTLDHNALCLAFAHVESSNRNLPPYMDGGSMSWGLYAFKGPRWVECGGSAKTWGKAGRGEQTRVMGCAIRRYLRTLPAGVDAITWAGTFHNNGHGRKKDTAYTIRLRAAYKKVGA